MNSNTCKLTIAEQLCCNYGEYISSSIKPYVFTLNRKNGYLKIS